MGGLAPMVDYLADDFETGNRISKAGFEVVLVDLVVETHLPAYTFRQFFDHQMRWARSTRDSRRRGYVGILLTFGLPWAVISVLLSAGAWWSWPMLALASLLRAAVAFQVGGRDRHDVAGPPHGGQGGEPGQQHELWPPPAHEGHGPYSSEATWR